MVQIVLAFIPRSSSCSSPPASSVGSPCPCPSSSWTGLRRRADGRALRPRRAACSRSLGSPAPARRLTPRILFAGAVRRRPRDRAPERWHRTHERQLTSALIVGAVPALAALVAAASGRGSLGPAGVGRVRAGARGRRDRRRRRRRRRFTLGGDALVLVSAAISATFVVVELSLLAGRDPIAVTAVQMVAGGARGGAQRGGSRAPAGARGCRGRWSRCPRWPSPDACPVRAVRLRAVACRARAGRNVPEP